MDSITKERIKTFFSMFDLTIGAIVKIAKGPEEGPDRQFIMRVSQNDTPEKVQKDFINKTFFDYEGRYYEIHHEVILGRRFYALITITPVPSQICKACGQIIEQEGKKDD